MPSAGGFSQTAINQRSGARTQLSELVTAVLAIACALFLASGLVFGLLPAVLVGVLLTLLLVLVELDRVGVTELEPTPGDHDVELAGVHTEPVPGF